MSLRNLILLAFASTATAANAGILLSEDFSGATSGTYGIGAISATQFAVTTANVDVGGVLNGGTFFGCTGNPAGNCLDLVGNSGSGGIASVPKFTLTAGNTYTVKFGGTLQSGPTNPAITTFRVGLGSLSEVLTVDLPYSPQIFSLNFMPIITEASAALSFTTIVPADSVHGEVIDHISLSEAAPAGAVPEPASWAMMLAGFGMIGGAIRRRATTAVRVAA